MELPGNPCSAFKLTNKLPKERSAGNYIQLPARVQLRYKEGMKKPKVYLCMHNPSTGRELCVQLEMQGRDSPVGGTGTGWTCSSPAEQGQSHSREGERSRRLHRAESPHYIRSREASLCPRAAGTSGAILCSLPLDPLHCWHLQKPSSPHPSCKEKPTPASNQSPSGKSKYPLSLPSRRQTTSPPGSPQ